MSAENKTDNNPSITITDCDNDGMPCSAKPQEEALAMLAFLSVVNGELAAIDYDSAEGHKRATTLDLRGGCTPATDEHIEHLESLGQSIGNGENVSVTLLDLNSTEPST